MNIRFLLLINFLGLGSISDKKKAIFESTLQLVVERGFHGCTISEVSKCSEAAAGTIYHHFENKEQLIQELYHYTMERIIKAMFEGDDRKIPFQTRFYKFCMNLFQFYIENPGVLRFYPQYVHSPYNTSRCEQGHDRFHEMIFSFFDEGVKCGSLKDVNPEILGILTHSNVMTSARIKVYGKIRMENDDLEQVIGIFWDGISFKHCS